MNVKTSFFNPTIYKKTLTQCSPFWITYLIILFMSQSYMLISLLRQHETGWYGAGLSEHEFLEIIKIQILSWNTADSILGIHIIFAAILGLGVLRYLYNNKFIGTIHALPIRRECLFVTNVLAGITMFAVPQILCTIISQIVGVCFGMNFAAVLGLNLIVSFAICLTSFSIAALATVLCGHTVSMPVIYLFLSFFAVGAEYLIKLYYELFTYGYSSVGEAKLSWLSPIYKLIVSISVDDNKYAYKPITIKTLIVYIIVSMLILCVSLFLYRIRHTEHCGDALAFRKFQPVVQVAFAWFISWIGVGVFVENTEADLILNQGAFVVFLLKLLFVGFVVYLLIKVILERSIHIIKTSWTQGVIFAAASVLLVVLLQSDPLGYEAKIPQATEVKRATLDGNSTLYLESEDGIQKVIDLQQACLDNKEEYLDKSKQFIYANNYVMETNPDIEIKEYLSYITIRYELINGKVMERNYPLILKKAEIGKSGATTNILCELEENSKWQLESLQHMITNPSRQLDEMNVISSDIYYSNFNQKIENEIYNAILDDLKDGKNMMQTSFQFADQDLKEDEFLVSLGYSVLDSDGEIILGNDYNYGFQSMMFFECLITPDCKNSYELLKKYLDTETGYEDSWPIIEEEEEIDRVIYEQEEVEFVDLD